jgi:hypothetical protein
VLASGGRLVVVHPIQAEQHGWGCFADSLYESLPPAHMPHGVLQNVEDPQDFVALLEQVGFEDVRSERRVKPVTFHDPEALIEAGWTVTGLSAQPADIQDRIRVRTRERMARYRTSQGTYEFPDVVLVSRGLERS